MSRSTETGSRATWTGSRATDDVSRVILGNLAVNPYIYATLADRPTVASWRDRSIRGSATSIAAACKTCDWMVATSWSFSGCWWNCECPASAPVVWRWPTSVQRRRAIMEETVSIGALRRSPVPVRLLTHLLNGNSMSERSAVYNTVQYTRKMNYIFMFTHQHW